MQKKRSLAASFLVVVCVCAFPRASAAEPQPSSDRLLWWTASWVQHNPSDWVYNTLVIWDHRFSGGTSAGERPPIAGGLELNLRGALDDRALGAALRGRVGRFLFVRAFYEHWTYFGRTALLSFEDASYQHGETLRERRVERDEDYATSGSVFGGSLHLRVAFGSVAVGNRAEARHVSMDLRGDDQVFFAPRVDMLVPGRGWLIESHAYASWTTGWPELVVGLQYDLQHSFFPHRALGPSGSDTNTPTQRVGPSLSWTFGRGSFWRGVTVFAASSWWVDHQQRTGQLSSWALPNTQLGFRGMYELWRSED